MPNDRPLPAEDFHVDADIRVAETLPARAFTDPEFQRLEMATLFERSWLLVPEPAAPGDLQRPLAEALAPRGARVPVTLLGRPLFLQRGWDDDALRLFPNTCTHAWYPLVLGPSRGPSVTCGQHGRKFSCDGRFLSQAGFEKAEGFPRESDHLTLMPVEAWAGLLFACLGAPRAPLEDVLAPVRASVAKLPLDRMTHSGVPPERRTVDGNWKLHAWNYMDSFHVAHVHRAPGGLADAIDLASYRTEIHGDAALQWAYARNPDHGFPTSQLPERFADTTGEGRRVFALWWLVLPNLALNFYPWGLSVNCWMPGGDPERTDFLWSHHVVDEDLYARRDATWLSEQVDREDVDALALVRRGMRSGHAPRGRFAAGAEAGPHWFHRRVYESVVLG